MIRFEPPSVKQRGLLVRPIAKAMHEASEAMTAGARTGRLVCGACGGPVLWTGNGTRSAGSCHSCRDVRWAT